MADRMSETFARDRYGADDPWLRAVLAARAIEARQLGHDAGIEDIGRERKPTRDYFPPNQQLETASTLYQVARMANPERFHEAVAGMPESENVVYGQPATAWQRLRAGALF